MNNRVHFFQVTTEYGSVGGCVSCSRCGCDVGPDTATVSAQYHVKSTSLLNSRRHMTLRTHELAKVFRMPRKYYVLYFF